MRNESIEERLRYRTHQPLRYANDKTDEDWCGHVQTDCRIRLASPGTERGVLGMR